MACCGKNSRPYGILAVVYYLELNPICKNTSISNYLIIKSLTNHAIEIEITCKVESNEETDKEKSGGRHYCGYAESAKQK